MCIRDSNGLVAAITLARAGWRVRVVEAAARAGGGLRTEELIEPGVRHDVCSAIHPLGIASPALRALPLTEHGVEWIQPDLPLAHPLDGGRAALLHRSVAETTAGLGPDAPAYERLFGPMVAAGARRGLDDAHPPAGAGQRDGGDEAVGSGADDDGVEVGIATGARAVEGPRVGRRRRSIVRQVIQHARPSARATTEHGRGRHYDRRGRGSRPGSGKW